MSSNSVNAVTRPLPPSSAPVSHQTAAFEAHTAPTGNEQEHIKRALEASQTAMDAIGTVTDLATYTLTVLSVVIGLAAIVGFVAIYRAARDSAKQIANERFDSYIASDEFKELVREKVDRSVDERWKASAADRIEEERRDPDDQSPFPPAPPPAGDDNG